MYSTFKLNHSVEYIHNMLVQHDMHERRADNHFSQWDQNQSEAILEFLCHAYAISQFFFLFFLVLN